MKRELVVLMSSAVVLSACAQIEDKLGKNKTDAEPVTVAVRTVSSLDVVDCACYVGRVEPSQSAVITSQYPGTLTELRVKKGTEVSRGEVLAVVRSESVRSAYDIALATKRQAQDGYDRMMEVYAKG
ncbi:MAG: biotin/lipoyl-binding protein, partial [Candidatus Cryptobacteroides sp.]